MRANRFADSRESLDSRESFQGSRTEPPFFWESRSQGAKTCESQVCSFCNENTDFSRERSCANRPDSHCESPGHPRSALDPAGLASMRPAFDRILLIECVSELVTDSSYRLNRWPKQAQTQMAERMRRQSWRQKLLLWRVVPLSPKTNQLLHSAGQQCDRYLATETQPGSSSWGKRDQAWYWIPQRNGTQCWVWCFERFASIPGTQSFGIPMLELIWNTMWHPVQKFRVINSLEPPHKQICNVTQRKLLGEFVCVIMSGTNSTGLRAGRLWANQLPLSKDVFFSNFKWLLWWTFLNILW